MDISNLASGYLDTYKQIASEKSSLEGNIKNDYSKATDEELMEACKQFEAYFLEQVFKEMSKTTKLTEEEGSNNTMVEYFKEQTIQKIAADSTETNSLGLAQSLYEQMRRNYGVSPDSISGISE